MNEPLRLIHQASPSVLDDAARLDVIDRLALRGHLGDADLDAIVATVADACRVPMAVVNIVTPGRQTYPAERGVGRECTDLPDHLSFCVEVVETGLPLVVPDARMHPVYAVNPFVRAGLVGAYAGHPVVHEGQVLGAISVFDPQPREFTPEELRVLESQAQLVGAVLRLRSLAAAARVSPVAVCAASSDAARGLTLEAAELGRAVAEGQLVLRYHPVMDLVTSQMTGVEALVRWQHPTRGLLSPSDFIPLAEESGLIVELGDWVLQQAAAQAARWSRAGYLIDVAVNLSPRQMAGRGFADHVGAILHSVAAPVARIVLEVTESALMDQSHAAATLADLRDQGIRLALDDFGTGYSSFSYLRRFPIDILKIDRSFVAGLGAYADDEAIVASVVGLARNTGKTVVAEGVQTTRQASMLRALGVPYGQGFLWSKPIPAAQVASWAAAHDERSLAFSAATLPLDAAEAVCEVPQGSSRAVIMGMHDAGASLHTIAAALNAEGRRTDSGTRWHVRSVGHVVTPPESRRPRGRAEHSA